VHTGTIVFGRPKPLDPNNPRELRAAFRFPADAARARGAVRTDTAGPCRKIVVEDMAKILDDGRVDRGFADIYDLKRAGYHQDVAAAIGPEAAKLVARRVAARGIREPFEADVEEAV
jgi:hypothetical protein